jgi:hypothetical protein
MKRKKNIISRMGINMECKGTELRLLGGSYYLYEVSSKWDAKKKCSIKIIDRLLSKITEKKGFVESEKV